jgi:predicted  nucleic acid-binding Zn-ribbon protein
MSITGAHVLSASIKDKIQAAKDRIAKTNTNTDAALAKFNNAADVADQVSKSIETEADDLMAELGQFTNGGPA